MSTLAIDPDTRELIRSGGSFVRIEGIDEILQNVRLRLRLLRGEVLLDQLAGPRYVDLVFVKGTPTSRIEGELIEQILAVPGMVSVDEMTITPDRVARTAVVEWTGTASVDEQRERILVQSRDTIAV